MKNIYSLLLLLLFALSSFAQEDSTASYHYRLVHLGIVPPISTNGKEAREYTNTFSLHLLWGESQHEYGRAISGLANIVRNSASGIQIAGLINRIGYDKSGSWPADFSNYVNGYGKGLAIAGLSNTAYKYDGVQIAAINRSAIQNGIQIGAANGTHTLNGLQIGMANGAGNMKGLQIGMMNFADTVKGLQIGIFNERKSGGVQIGIMNLADHNDWPIGIVNLIKDGDKKIGISVDEIASTIISYRSGGRYLYGVVGLGYNFKSDHHHMVIETGLGGHIHLSERFRIDNEVTWTALSVSDIKNGWKDEDEKDDHNFRLLYKASYRLLPVFKCSERIEIFGGPTINYMWSRHLDNRHIFPSKHLWRDFSDKTLKQVHLGGIIGVQYIF